MSEHRYGYKGREDLCVAPAPGGTLNMTLVPVVFFICFTVVGALVLLTLFIGVVTTSMEAATARQEEQQVNQQLLSLSLSLSLSLYVFGRCFFLRAAPRRLQRLLILPLLLVLTPSLAPLLADWRWRGWVAWRSPAGRGRKEKVLLKQQRDTTTTTLLFRGALLRCIARAAGCFSKTYVL